MPIPADRPAAAKPSDDLVISPVERRRREAGAPQDEALYSCECGFVFSAAVSTSVGCPHCGGPQAW